MLVAASIGALALLSRFEVVARRDGAAFFVAIGLWALSRFVVAFTWRDPIVAGPLRAEQVMLLILVGLAVVGLIERSRAPLQGATPYRAGLADEPAG
jgi:hypothetical protein